MSEVCRIEASRELRRKNDIRMLSLQQWSESIATQTCTLKFRQEADKSKSKLRTDLAPE